jgi:photosystem II stability/assembly factor-like uncharacterized protein
MAGFLPRISLGFLVAAALLSHPSSVFSSDDSNQVVAPDTLQALKYRPVGPYRGGRVTAVSGTPKDIFTYFMGTTGGGVWKTSDAGQTWNNISDGFIKVGSIGAIAVAPSDLNVIYVGTGSACPRGNISPGDGVYKSTDGGKTWVHQGLDDAGLIARIRVHPDNPELVYVSVLGNIFGASEDRGIFRSEDGGQNWEKVLFVNDRTGSCDLDLDLNNPRILYAAMWQAERKPWTLIDGGPDGGVFKTVDGGDTWDRLEVDLPDGVQGRIGVSVSPVQPERVWVIVEAKEEEKGGVYRSDDGGESFTRINREHKLRTRAWYYNHIFADSQDPETVYIANAGFYKSIDGGKTFDRIPTPHGDNHDLWINPSNNRIMIEGNDGGANVTFNGGETWSTILNQPTAEFYRVTVDNGFPYRLYGAQQDNSTISVPSRSPGGITPKEHWFEVGGGESGHIAVDPRNRDLIYAGNYIGQITRKDRKRSHVRDIVAYPQMHDGVAPRDIRYRFQWNAPIRISPHDPDVLYHCSQYVHRSTDAGHSWEVISPDLTTNNDDYHNLPGGPIQHDHTGVELYTTIFAFEESPERKGELWAGSDDGLVHLSLDSGKTWENVTPAEMPEEGTVNTIEISAHARGRVYMAVYRYRRNDFRPYVFRTDNYGKSWTLLTDGNNGIPENHFVRVVREDPDRKGLLYAGTEFGMYISFDDGSHWQSLQLNLPATPITDLAVHQQDLVVATQGRSFWILDNLTPLHQISPDTVAGDAFLYQPRPAYRTQARGFRMESAPEPFEYGAEIYFHLSEEKLEQAVKIEIRDGEGDLIRTIKSEKSEDEEAEKDNSDEQEFETEAGLNRVVWDLTYPSPDLLENSFMSLSNTRGPKAPPGQYQVELRIGEWSQIRDLAVKKDPRWEWSDEDLRSQFELVMAIRDKLVESHDSVRKIRSIREQTKQITERAIEAGHDQAIKDRFEALNEGLTEIEEALIQTRSESRQDPINYPPKLDNQLAYLYSVVNSQDALPTAGSYERFDDLKAELAGYVDELNGLIQRDLADFNRLLDTNGIGHIILPPDRKGP